MPRSSHHAPNVSNPRRRGDDNQGGGGEAGGFEQPPQARGRPAAPLGRRGSRGATPAGAGTTPGARRGARAAPSNPRRRGDDHPAVTPAEETPEQPPQARGRPGRRPPAGRWWRATPAGAGTTTSSSTRTRTVRSNPRRRGDDTTVMAQLVHRDEQPPQARGRPRPCGSRAGAAGATPAGAGTTRRPCSTCSRSTSNPRRRGDDVAKLTDAKLDDEQPPQARGRPARRPCPGLARRATPAGAGTTIGAKVGPLLHGSNPRRRGDDHVASALTPP